MIEVFNRSFIEVISDLERIVGGLSEVFNRSFIEVISDLERIVGV